MKDWPIVILSIVCIVVSVGFIMFVLAGCTTAIGNEKTGDYFIMAFLQGTAYGHMDPNSGGSWRRTGPTDMSGVEIVRDREGYSVAFDSAKSKTEFDNMMKVLEMGVAIGEAKVGVPGR